MAGCNQNATDELASIFPEFDGKAFDNPKPVELISRIIGMSTHRDSLVLDAFAGSGTTGEAVLRQNRSDAGCRSFILIEMGNYADNITAERVRRVVSGYREDKNAVEGIGSGFSYYELGPALFADDGTVNEGVSFVDLARYVWATETRAPYVDCTEEHPYLLGVRAQAVYYLAWEPGKETTLTYDLLRELPRKGSPTVIYAERCAIAPERLNKMNIVFKRLPDQIARI